MRERRATQRYGLQVRIAFRRVPKLGQDSVLAGETRDISTGGMFFTAAHSVAFGEVLDFSLTLPGLAHGADVLVTGRARVVRVTQNSELASRPAGIAVVTEEYHILEPEAAA